MAKGPRPMSEAQVVSVPLGGGREYDIHIGAGLLAGCGTLACAVAPGRRAVLITQPTIARRWAAPVVDALTAAGFDTPPVLTFAGGERFKTLATMAALYGKLYNLSTPVDRKTLLIALGGGVVGDVAGFVAATYLRGLPYVQLPTTLLAMVDSSVGGKTGVDLGQGKNLVGAFHQPRLVVADTDTLSTLPRREMRAGLAEVIKYGVIRDPALLPLVVKSLTGSGAVAEIVRRSCQIKAEVVVGDEFEQTGLRAVLNFGHTIGHALESATHYKRYRHGEAVGIGMVAAAYIGEVQGVTPPDVREALTATLGACSLPAHLPDDVGDDALLALTGRDKKAEGGQVRWVLAHKLGEVRLHSDVDALTVREGLRRMRHEAHP